jgi:hypothetical protein
MLSRTKVSPAFLFILKEEINKYRIRDRIRQC